MLKSVSVTISRRRKPPASRSIRFERVAIAVRIDEPRGLRQAAAVDEAGVILRVAEDRVLFLDQRRNDAGVGGEAGGKNERGFRAFELGQPPFQFGVRFAAAADERAGAAAPAFALGGDAGGLGQALVRRRGPGNRSSRS